MDEEIKNIGLLGAADENQSDDREEDLSNCEYVDFDEDVCKYFKKIYSLKPLLN